MKIFTFRVEFEKEDDGRYSAYVPSLSGCHSWGGTLEEARANIGEALRLHIEALLANGDAIPSEKQETPATHEETFSIAV